MFFTSYEFLLFAVTLLTLYYIVPKKIQWLLLLLASYIFYGLSGVGNLVFIVTTTLITYICSILIYKQNEKSEKYLEIHKEIMDKEARKEYKASEKKKRFYLLIGGLSLGFGILAVLKYTAFAVNNINSIIVAFGMNKLPIPQLLLPMGISFYTFQSMGYLIDVYRGKAKVEKNVAKLALFISYFPQLIQGPISRFSDLETQLIAEHDFDIEKLFRGIIRVLWGYFKKLVIADRILIPVKTLIERADEYSGVYVVLLILFYSIQIYTDFTGGIDITIGISEALGIELKENFRHPFFSKSTKEYWRRWHITMGTWFSDYIFYPLSVTKFMQKLSKKSRALFGASVGKRIPVYIATIITWFLTGLWHGAGWNFIVWGLLNCFVILVSQELQPLYDRFHSKFPKLSGSSLYSVFMMTRTFWLMGTIRVLDCYRDVPLTFKMLFSIFNTPNWNAIFDGSILLLGIGISDLILIGVGCLIMIVVSAVSEKMDIRKYLFQHTFQACLMTGLLIISVVVFGAYGIGYDANQFIYNQF